MSSACVLRTAAAHPSSYWFNRDAGWEPLQARPVQTPGTRESTSGTGRSSSAPLRPSSASGAGLGAMLSPLCTCPLPLASLQPTLGLWLQRKPQVCDPSPGQRLAVCWLLHGWEETGCVVGSAKRDPAEVCLSLSCCTPRISALQKPEGF